MTPRRHSSTARARHDTPPITQHPDNPRRDFLCDACGHTVHTVVRASGILPRALRCPRCGHGAHLVAAVDMNAAPSHEWVKGCCGKLAIKAVPAEVGA